VAAAWEEALHSDRPVVIDAHTDPEVPPLPPHISAAQARHFLSSMLHGDPATGHMLRQSLKDMAENWIPHRS
jgi:pyruvate dehydrogenase (quinone)